MAGKARRRSEPSKVDSLSTIEANPDADAVTDEAVIYHSTEDSPSASLEAAAKKGRAASAD
jgi:hypothetical protein